MPDFVFSPASPGGSGLSTDRASRLLENALTTKDGAPEGWREMLHRPPPVEQLREWVPEYDVEQRVARGSSGWVYVARHLLLDRRVALKVLLPAEPGYEKETAAVRSSEGRLIARLSHPNVLRVYDSRPLPEGLHLFVFEYAEGGSLRQRLGAKGLPRAEASALALGIARGLAEAHAAGIIHRDLKPENIVFQTADVPMIADFGSAVNPAAEDAATGCGTTGTLNYRAPEQATGGPLTTAVDLYAFGVVLHEMLTGKVPEGTGFDRPVGLAPELTAEWKPLLTQLLHPDPLRRGPGAQDLVSRLKRMSKPWIPRWAQVAGILCGIMLTGYFLTRKPATPSPEITPSPPIPPVEEPAVRLIPPAQAQAEVEEVIDAYRAGEAGGDWEDGNRFYGGLVDYFGDGALTHKDVVAKRMAHVQEREYIRMLLLETPSHNHMLPMVQHRGFYWLVGKRRSGGFDLGFVKDELTLSPVNAKASAPAWQITTHRQGVPTVVWSCEAGRQLTDAEALAWVDQFLQDEASGIQQAQVNHYAPVTFYYGDGWIATRLLRTSLQKRALERPGFRCERRGPVTVVAGSCLRWRVSFPCLSYPLLENMPGGDQVRVRTFLLAPRAGGSWQVIAEASSRSGQAALDAFWNDGAGLKD